MKTIAMLGGLLGIIISLTAQLFAIIDDSYTFGNIGFLGVLSGIIGIIGAFQVNRNNKLAAIILISSAILGFISISYLYILPATLVLISSVFAAKNIKE
ncbi:hypothetical protein [Virgibacillus halodenitrificans]|uniref:DUF4064 domain-containing protein n=1 Tax=Virgibacillus halodenitrificans TaxID=1482 RepID=A0AAC9J1A3_VIRHA|nr:hypothetical protein [Virgibacillus halodenitrificans]APC48844.1 hypothetical protein BME96_11850 [Virgibacillus halodenitrificans]